MKYHKDEPLFTATAKMADLILENYKLLSMLPRFGITLGFNEKSVSTICKEANISQELFLMICNINSYDHYTPNAEELESIKIEELVEYLTRSHSYYADERLSGIESKLELIKQGCDSAHHQIVAKFFGEYKQEVLNHFDYEDRVIFPYIKSLVRERIEQTFDVEQYEKNHENIDDKLSDLKSIIIKYLPESYPSERRIEILNDIFILEDDLSKHTCIEERILIPLVKNIEHDNGK
ncbi:MAG: hemerythrin domain-containing protein [Rikenellaceae bacterium]